MVEVFEKKERRKKKGGGQLVTLSLFVVVLKTKIYIRALNEQDL